MPTYTNAYSGFSTNDIAATRRFYADTLGLEATEENGNIVSVIEESG